MAPEQIRRLLKWLSEPEAKLVSKHLQALAEERQLAALGSLRDNNPDLAVTQMQDARDYERLIEILGQMNAAQNSEAQEYEYLIPIEAQTL